MPRAKLIGEQLLQFVSPATGLYVNVRVAPGPGGGAVWNWNGSLETPTLGPSVRHLDSKWHYYVENGRIRYLEDSPCGAPQMVVDLPDLDEWTQECACVCWTVYANPKDFPGQHVVRRWYDDRPGQWAYVAPSLEAARRVIPKGLSNVRRLHGDDPCIVECWM